MKRQEATRRLLLAGSRDSTSAVAATLVRIMQLAAAAAAAADAWEFLILENGRASRG